MNFLLGLYRHRSGKMYQAISVARDVATHKEVIVYRALYGEYGVWTRNRDDFEARVNGVYRFKFMHHMNNRAPDVVVKYQERKPKS
jgi:hypothetical protein